MTTLKRELPPDLTLAKGSHEEPGDEFAACFVEAASWIAGDKWSDHPECVCPVIAAFGRLWNDSMDDEDRQILVPYIARIVGTRSTPQVEQRRAWMAADWIVREYTPAWLRLAGLNDQAHTLEQLAALTDTATAREAKPSVDAAGTAARAAAGTAAGTAAWDAAWDALRPTVKALQVSALALLDRMIEAGES